MNGTGVGVKGSNSLEIQFKSYNATDIYLFMHQEDMEERKLIVMAS
jgi:hypothetical protein